MTHSVSQDFLVLPRETLADAALSAAKSLGASHADFRLERLRQQGIRLRDVVGDVKWKPKSDPDTLLVHVIAPKLEEPEPTAPEAAAPAAPSEPELIKKGKAEKPEGQ